MTQPNSRRGEQGFTLVELAIVMIIIGLLIGGILKGQELVSNARVASSVSQVKAIDAAISTFRDAYNGFPGDLLQPTNRIPNCPTGTICGRVGSGNGLLDVSPSVADANINKETYAAYAQLSGADMLSGVRSDTPTATAPTVDNQTYPKSNLTGGFQIGYSTGAAGQLAAATVTDANLIPRAGHYLLLDNSAAATAAAGTASLTAAQAARMDNKLDDGRPNTGSVVAMGGGAGAATCASAADATGIYNERLGGNLCGLYVRVQQ